MIEGLVSIIVPVYNVERYLKRCVESLLHQSYRQIEIILVDDGSTDSSGKLCDEYSKISNKINIIHKANEGVAAARNIGIDNVNGEFVMFVDSDDYLNQDMITVLIEPFKERENLSFTSCGYYNVFSNQNITNRNSNNRKYFNKQECETSLAMNREICFMVWNKLFRQDVIANIRFKADQLHEEIYFMHEICKRITEVCYIDIPLYYYTRERTGNTNSKFRISQMAALSELQSFEEDMVKEENSQAAVGLRIMQMEFIISIYAKCNKTDYSYVCNDLLNRFEQIYSLDMPYTSKQAIKYTLFRKMPSVFLRILKYKNKFSKKKYIM